MISYTGFSQIICNEMIVNNDEVAEITKIKSKDLVYDNMTVNIESGVRKSYYPKVTFKLKNVCFDEGNKLIIVFSNGEKLTIFNRLYGFNCNGITGFIVNNESYKKKLINNQITIIRVYYNDTNENFYEVKLTLLQSDELLKTFQCAINRSWESEIKYKNTGW